MKVLIKIKDRKLEFLNRKKLNTEYKNMLNTNVISNDELVFSDEYIKANYKLIVPFLNELIKNYNIKILAFQNMEIATLLLPTYNKLKGINAIYFDSEDVLSYKICEKLTKCNNIKYISANYIPQYMFELLDKYGIIPESRDEILFTSSFMELNNLINYSSIFYKYIVYVDFPLTTDDLNDFASFCNINRNLRTVHVNLPNKVNLEQIIYLLHEYNHKNIKIIIHGDTLDEDVIEYLKKYHNILKKKYKIKPIITYSETFIKNNLFEETNNIVLKTCALLLLILIIGSIALIFGDNIRSMKEVSKIQNDIQEYIIATDHEEVVSKMEQKSDLQIKNKYLASLTTINPDIKAWLKVNNTDIDYAIVQAENNSYYLNNNIYNKKDPTGWLFMDFQNTTEELSENTIIYGHNRFVNGVMFGSLNKVLYKDWYNNPENYTIRFDTYYENYEFEVFSIYTINTTTDYIKTSFDDKKEKVELLKTLKERSIHKFDVNVDENSKILTLSTCGSDTTRIVLHAVLKQ